MHLPQEIERSNQHIPPTSPEYLHLAPSRPLHELADAAPALPRTPVLDLENVNFPFSNDDSVTYYDQVQSRSSMPEYRQATNRTAIIVGEGSLMAALPMISEDTIILLDSSPEMCSFMERYVDTLRRAEDPDDWGEQMGLKEKGVHEMGVGAERPVTKLREQALEWMDAGYGHPLEHDTGFKQARKHARRKAIIPWNADLENEEDLRHLGDTLRAHDAEVTFLNLTNSFGHEEQAVDEAAGLAERLAHLPVTPSAPILTTSFVPKVPLPVQGAPRAQATGPFFGLKNLAEHGEASIGHFAGQDKQRLKAELLGPMVMDLLESALNGGSGRVGGMSIEIIALDQNGSEPIPFSGLPPEIRSALKSDLGDQYLW